MNYLGSTLTWQNGRELATFTNSQYSISYSYDVNGLRTEKAVTQGGVTTDYQYFYNGSTLLQERIDNGTGTDTVLNFIYTADGKPYALEYSINGGSSYTTYYYLTNLQGDVVSILDSSGTAAVTYSYDSWGKITQTTGTLATTLGKDNPLCYRGYVYDEETNLYYLQSRYYDPQICRFINADSIIGSTKNLLGTNTFVYCGNDAINNIDPAGTDWWHWAVAVTVVAALVVASVVTCGGVTLAAVTASAIATGTCTTVSATATIVTGAAMGAAAGLAIGVMEADISSVEGFSESGEQALASTAYGVVAGTAAGIVNEYFLCFVAGTLVLTEDGEEPIEEIQPGDYVWSWDEETGETQLQPVLETYINETNELVRVSVAGEEIVCTPNHPFYSPVKGWTEACRLRAGDVLLTVNGEYVVVVWVQHELLERLSKVYNFSVEFNHNYFVSNTKVLVHNTCRYNTPQGGGGVSDKVEVDGTTVTFGHGGRHLQNSGIDINGVNHYIASDIVSKNIDFSVDVQYFDLSYNGISIHYGAWRRTDTLINIGTYYVK